MEEELEDALICMDIYGGHFVQRLATLYRTGDPTNKAKLRAAFMNYFDEYAEMAKGSGKEAVEAAKGP